jgi:hypothetical protein
MEEYKDIFTFPTRVHLQFQVKNSINLIPSMTLPNGTIYRHSFLENEEIKCHIQEFLQKENIWESSSPCGNPIALVKKKDGTWRLYIDYISLNKIIVRNHYPIHQIDNLLDQVKGAKFFSKINLKLGYKSRFQSNKLMFGILPSSIKMLFLNGGSFLLV